MTNPFQAELERRGATGGSNPFMAEMERRAATPKAEGSSFEDVTEATARGMVRGIPIVGPSLERGIEHVESFLTGRSPEDIQTRGQDLRGQHPMLSTGSEIAGSVAGMAGPVAAAPRLFGAAGGLVSRLATGAGSGAAVGAADAVARDQDPLQGAAIGGVSGAAGAALGRAVEVIRKARLNARPSVTMKAEYKSLPDAVKQSKDGKELYKHALAAERLEGIIEKGGSPNAIRGAFRRIANSAKELRRYPEEMQQTIRNIAYGQGEVDVATMAAEMAGAYLPGGRMIGTFAAQKAKSRDLVEGAAGMLGELTGTSATVAPRVGATLPIVAAGQAVEPARSRMAAGGAPGDALQDEMIRRLLRGN